MKSSIVPKSWFENLKISLKNNSSIHNATPTHYGCPHKKFSKKLLSFSKAPNS